MTAMVDDWRQRRLRLKKTGWGGVGKVSCVWAGGGGGR